MNSLTSSERAVARIEATSDTGCQNLAARVAQPAAPRAEGGLPAGNGLSTA
jgi:hypothetical protein